MTATMNIAIEPIPANPGYLARIDGGDPECDPIGSGATRMAAALDLARSLLDAEDNHPALCLAIAAVLREEMETLGGGAELHREVFQRAIRTVEGIW